MSTKEQQNRAILATSSISTYDNGEMRHIQTKTSIWIQSWSNQFWNRIANVSVKKRRGNFKPKPGPRMKKLNPNTHETILTRKINQKRGVYMFLHICSNNISSQGPWIVWISKISFFFLVFADQKHSSETSRATNERVDSLAPLILLKTEYCEKRWRVSKNI